MKWRTLTLQETILKENFMWPFTKKPITIKLIKTVKLSRDLEMNEVSYHCTATKDIGFGHMYDSYVANSNFQGSESEKGALKFFDKLVELKGQSSSEVVLKEVTVKE